MEKEYVTLSHFKKLISSQPFFIWNSLENKNVFDVKESIDFSWEDFSTVAQESNNANYGQVLARTFSLIDAHLTEMLVKDFETIIISGTTEEAIEKTKQYMDSGKMLISPVFEYEGAISKPFAFDTKTKSIIELKYSKKTKLSDLTSPYWNYSIITKNGFKVFDIALFLPNPESFKKGVIDLIAVKEVHKTKTAKYPFEPNTKTEINILQTIINNDASFSFPTIDDALDKIEKAKESQIEVSKIHLDYDQLFKNKEFDVLLDKIEFKYSGWNGKIIKTKNIQEYLDTEQEELFNSELKNTVDSAKTVVIDKTRLNEINQIDNAKRVIWYDFEGYSLPIPPMDGIGSYNQLVFQVSIIETVNNVEVSKKNIVVDPQNISLEDLYKILKEVYSNKADKYVVYNKGYENVRIREYVQLMLHDPKHLNFPNAEQMYLHIDNNTIDLMNLFVINSPKKIPPIILPGQKAKYSIKNVEKYISTNNIQVPRPIKEYQNMEIKNGGMAMQEAINRAIGITGDLEWKNKLQKLEEYCENDVRAMIMVYDFVKGLCKDD